MDFKDLEGRTVKISAHTITAKDERGKTCGMVRNVRNFLDVSQLNDEQFDFLRMDLFIIQKMPALCQVIAILQKYRMN